MFSDALAGDGNIGVVQLKPGGEKDYYGNPAVYRVLGVGTIRASERWPDGRYDVVLEGTARGRIVSESQRGDYRVAEVELLPDQLGEDSRAEIDALHSLFLPSFRRIASHDDIAQSGLRPRSWDDPGPGSSPMCWRQSSSRTPTTCRAYSAKPMCCGACNSCASTCAPCSTAWHRAGRRQARASCRARRDGAAAISASFDRFIRMPIATMLMSSELPP